MNVLDALSDGSPDLTQAAQAAALRIHQIATQKPSAPDFDLEHATWEDWLSRLPESYFVYRAA